MCSASRGEQPGFEATALEVLGAREREHAAAEEREAVPVVQVGGDVGGAQDLVDSAGDVMCVISATAGPFWCSVIATPVTCGLSCYLIIIMMSNRQKLLRARS